jgi:hypothetical protein
VDRLGGREHHPIQERRDGRNDLFRSTNHLGRFRFGDAQDAGALGVGIEPGRVDQDLAAQTLVMEAQATQVATMQLDVCATRTNARLGTVSAIAEAIETIATRIIGEVLAEIDGRPA